MDDCIYYQTDKEEKPQSKELNSTRQRVTMEYVERKFCSHKHSPLTREDILKICFGSELLECKGKSEKCPIPKHKLLYDRY